MYTVYAENFKAGSEGRYLLYAPSMVSFGFNIFSARPINELGKAGSFSFTIPGNHPNYDNLYKLSTIVTVYEDNDIIWKGRIIDSRRDFMKNKILSCEGELAYLNDIQIDEFDYETNGIAPESFFNDVVRQYNSQCSIYRRINRGEFHYMPDENSSQGESYNETLYDGPGKIYIKDENWQDALSALNTYIVDRLGGFLVIRHEIEGMREVSYIDYYAASYLNDYQSKIDEDDSAAVANMINQEIVFGKNLINIEEFIDASEVFTAVVPLGAKKESKHSWDTSYKGRWNINALEYTQNAGTEEEVSTHSGEKYVAYKKGVDMFGMIIKTIVFDEIDNNGPYGTISENVVMRRLFDKGVKELRNSFKMALNITISAVDLHLLDVNTDSMSVGKYAKVISLPHGINEYYIISKTEVDIMNPSQSSYTLGLDTDTFVDKHVYGMKKLNAEYDRTISALSDLA